MKKSKFIALSIVLALLLNMIMPLMNVVAFSSYTITIEATEGHILEKEDGHLKIDNQYVDPREATDYTVSVEENTATITINDGAETTLNFNTANLFKLFDGDNEVSNNTNFSSNTVLSVRDANYSSGYTLTFTVKEGLTGDNYIISRDGNHLIIGDTYIDLVDVSNPETNIVSSINVASDGKSATVVSSGTMAGILGFNTNKFSLYANGQKVRENTIFDSNTQIQIEEYVNDSDEHDEGQGDGFNTRDYNGNASATLNYKITGVIEYTSGGGYDHGISFRINDIPYAADESTMQYSEDTAYERTGYGELVLDENNNPIVIKDPETNEPMTEKTGLTINGDTINYDYDTETNKVNFTFVMAPGTLMTGLKINNKTITNLPSTKEELAVCYTDHRLEIEVKDIDKADVYNIEITARYPNSNEEFLGNFLWDYNPQGYTGPEDKILNATLTFVEAEYDGHKYTKEEEINALGGVFIWRDAERKKKYTDEREGVGEAQFPTGTKLTVKIIPDAGYQLVDFGINGGVFDPQEEIGTYTFVVQGGPFHLQATIKQVENVVKTKSESVASGNIELSREEKSMTIGTARLDVNDIELDKEQITNFEKAAEGYTISDYLDISLYNTVYKGKETESWDTQVKELENEATITLKLEDGVDVNDVVIVHEKHDGTYEIIKIDSYDAETNTITFKTKSFSNYAIAAKTKDKIEVKKDNVVLSFAGQGESSDYKLEIIDLLNLTDDQLREFEITKEQYNELFDKVKENTKNYGELLLFYEITVVNKDGESVEKGEFEIKIPLTEELKKYNSFKLLNINDDMKVEEAVTLKIEGDYLVGSLPHLSAYALVGEKVESTSNNPTTGDNIIVYVVIFAASALFGMTLIIKNKKNTKNKKQH